MKAPLKALCVACATVLAASLGSCGLDAPADRSLLTHEPCAPPCWQGLLPDVSTLAEVSQYVESSSVVGEHYRDTYADRTIIRWQSTIGGRSQRTWNAFSIRDGVLIAMRIHLDYEVTLEQLLDKYGIPEKFRTQLESGGGVDALVNLYYPAQGLIAQLEVDPSDGHHELEEETKVTRVWYFSPTSVDGLFDLAGVVPFPDKKEHAEMVLQDWHGYGFVDLR